jgi:hypothetical protein
MDPDRIITESVEMFIRYVENSLWSYVKEFTIWITYNQIFWEVVGLERVSLSLVRIIEELFQGNSSSGVVSYCSTTATG